MFVVLEKVEYWRLSLEDCAQVLSTYIGGWARFKTSPCYDDVCSHKIGQDKIL